MFNNIHIDTNGDSTVETSHKTLEHAVRASNKFTTDFIESSVTGKIFDSQSGSQLCAECLNYMGAEEIKNHDVECQDCIEDSFRR
jgi:hypothetical protein